MSKIQQLNRVSVQTGVDTSDFVKNDPVTFSLFLVYTMWVLLLYQPEALLASFGLGPLKRLPTIVLFFATVFVLVTPNRRAWYWPMVLLLITHTMVLPFVTNRGYAMDPFKAVFYYTILLAASIITIDNVQKASRLLTIFVVQFIWWGISGLPDGKVRWHSEFGDEDGFGPLMVVGMAFTAFYAMGSKNKGVQIRWVFGALLCTFGLVASFARGAFVSAGAVLFVLWLRSHRKLLMLGCIILIIGAVFTASNLLFSEGKFWTEMFTSLEGFDDPTGRDRADLWSAGWETFLRSPIIGVGPNNFGSYAAENFQEGDAPGFYADPAHLYGRHLHNVFVQVLAEQGLVGVTIFLWLLVDFVRRNRHLRTKEAVEYWDNATGGRTDLQAISRGLEGAMIGFLATGYFYNQLYTVTFYSLIILNIILHINTKPQLNLPKLAQRNAG